ANLRSGVFVRRERERGHARKDSARQRGTHRGHALRGEGDRGDMAVDSVRIERHQRELTAGGSTGDVDAGVRYRRLHLSGVQGQRIRGVAKRLLRLSAVRARRREGEQRESYGNERSASAGSEHWLTPGAGDS